MMQMADVAQAGIDAFLICFEHGPFTPQEKEIFDLAKNALGKDFVKHSVFVSTKTSEPPEFNEIHRSLAEVLGELDQRTTHSEAYGADERKKSRQRVFENVSSFI